MRWSSSVRVVGSGPNNPEKEASPANVSHAKLMLCNPESSKKNTVLEFIISSFNHSFSITGKERRIGFMLTTLVILLVKS